MSATASNREEMVPTEALYCKLRWGITIPRSFGVRMAHLPRREGRSAPPDASPARFPCLI
jgi:hypothetical protein